MHKKISLFVLKRQRIWESPDTFLSFLRAQYPVARLTPSYSEQSASASPGWSAWRMGFHSQVFSHIPETEENQNRDAEEEIPSDAQTTNLAVYL